MTALPFDNSYARLPERFYARRPPTPVAAPRLVRLNRPLAEELGLDPVVRADDAAAVPTVRNPVTWSATPPSYRRSPPPLGADSAEVRAWLDQNR